MRAPVSWIREYVDLPADVTPAELARRLTMLGLKLESLVSAGDQISGPLVVGRVLTLEREPQKNGKTICWCTVDVGDANGTGEPQGIVCGAHNFEVGDLVVVILPGGVLPGNFEISARKTYGHVSAGMICSSRELGLGEDHEGIIVLPAGAGEPGEDARRVLGLDDTVIEFEINPDRAYALSMRGIAREAALGFGVAFHDPADRTPPAANDRGYPVVVEDPDGCPVFVARSVTGFDPASPTPDWMVRRLAQCGVRSISLGVDITNYVMLETGQPIHGFDRSKLAGPIVVRRARAGEKVTTLDGTVRDVSTEDLLITDDSGPIGLAGVMGGETTELSETTTDILVEAANWHPASIFRTERRHKLPSEASRRFERGVDPELPAAAADRVVELLAELGGGTIEEGVTVVGGAPERRTVSADADLPARDLRDGDPGADRRGAPRGRRLRRRGRRRPVDRDGAALAPRPRRPVRPGGGGRPGPGLRPGAVGAAAGAVRRGPDPRPAAATPGRTHPGRGRVRRGGQLPLRRRPRLRRPGALRRRRAAHHPAAGQPVVVGGAGDDHHPAARPAEGGRPQRGTWNRPMSRSSSPRP